ncbi:cytochrome oxidase assembly protein ShyY1 [Micromonospora sp. Llam0]|uniref:SURF1 family cytochrome oxidase biogenesis protein n=1 Tax=Micromonospora sp. Llam0 TaxID=2485143 RepID=UPI000F476066|nr:SURF1 family protein [Micromonospora sp. Llam0]ROO62003.1 cytochrome oxidase assembly protein ShyY1 [Micromonospora sp. Llam0]
MYRFLLTPRWLGYLVVALAAAAVMVQLGNWQLDRYHQRSAVNDRIDAAGQQTPVELTRAAGRPGPAPRQAGDAPPESATWTRVTAVGRYDSDNHVLVRSRTVNSRVGYEVLTPLVLADGSAVLVDRGWIPPDDSGLAVAPPVPPVPADEVTVTGLLRQPEPMSGSVTRQDGTLQTRRIATPVLAAELPYPIYGGYVLLQEQDPPAAPVFVAVPIRHENSWQNGGYVAQWWIFAAMTLVGFGWLARREAHNRRRPAAGGGDRAADSAGDRADATGGGAGPVDQRPSAVR